MDSPGGNNSRFPESAAPATHPTPNPGSVADPNTVYRRYNPENPRQHRSQPPRPKSSIDQRFWAMEDANNAAAAAERQRYCEKHINPTAMSVNLKALQRPLYP